MSRYKYIIFVTLVFFITREMYLQTGLSSAYGAGLSATDSIAPGEDAQLPFGEVAVGKSSASGDVTVKNNSGSGITISSIELTGPHKSSFRLSSDDGTATSCSPPPKTLPDGESCTLSVLFAPESAGPQAAFLDISLGSNLVEKIAFEDTLTNGISLYDIASKSVTPLTNPGPNTEDRNPSWSPNGRQIVFNRHNQDGSDDISLKNIDDIDIPVENILIAGNRAGGTMPAWSPDGGILAFRNEQFGGISLWRFGPIFVDLGTVFTGERFNPSWSPDGREIVFQRTDPFVFSKDIFKLTIDSNNQADFTEKKIISNGRTPSWSPDGTRIAYHDNASNGIFIHTLNGGSNHRLTSPQFENRDLHPSWSPDGNQIVFHHSSSDDLIVVNVSDGSVDETFIDLKKGKNPAWSPPLSSLALALSGTGTTVGTNSPPSAPQLISPDKGAQGVSTNVMFKWLEGIDPEGDPVIHELKVCEDNQFSFGCIPTNVVKLEQQKMFFAGMGTVGGSTLLLFGVGVVFLTRRHSAYGSLILCGLITATLLAGCSGGGGGGSAPFTATEKEEITREITGLKTNQDYFWKVTVRDDQGNATLSEVRQFTTRP